MEIEKHQISSEISLNKKKNTKALFDYGIADPHDFTPCSFQIKLYTEAKDQNIIICLENDSTKTFISIMLIDYFLFKTKKNLNPKTKKIFVVESNESTIDQRINCILSNLNLKELVIKNNDKFYINESEFVQKFYKSDLIISTIEVAHFLFNNHYVEMEDFCLIVFNDVHRIFEKNESLSIMNYYNKSLDKPRILCFCVSLINNESTTKRMNVFIEKIENIFKSVCKTSVSIYNYKPKEIIIRIRPQPIQIYFNKNFKNAFDKIHSLVKFIEKSKIKPKSESMIDLKNTKNYLSILIFVLETMGIWCAKKLLENYINELSEIILVTMKNDSTYAAVLSSLNTLFNYLKKVFSQYLSSYDLNEQLNLLTQPKLRCLTKVLKENLISFNEKTVKEIDKKKKKKFQDNFFSCIIIVKKREVARVLAIYLNEIAKVETGFNLNAESIVCEKKIAKNFEELKPNKKQEEIIGKFKKQICNTLVLTSSFEEKLEIPKSSLVIRYDLPTSAKEYMQSKERCKPENSKLIFFVEENSNDEERLFEFVQQEKILLLKFKNAKENEEKILIEKNIDLESVEKSIVPFKPDNVDGIESREANALISIAIINRYCSKLPSDSFTKLIPRWNIKEKFDVETGFKLYQCQLSLPINSPIRYPIEGEFLITEKLAKKSAAIRACQKLYECGELDENFIPICKENIKGLNNNELEIEDSEPDNFNLYVAGSPKKRRYYNKRTAKALTGNVLKPNEECYFYIFTMKLTCPIPDEQNTRGRKIIDPADYDLNFGLVIKNQIPKICDFPVFTRSGEVVVELKNIPKKIFLNDENFSKLVDFHKFTFKNVLQLEKYPMKFDYANSNCSYLIVPIRYNVKENDNCLSNAEIDWSFIKKVEDYQAKISDVNFLKNYDLTSKNRPKFQFDKSLYKDAVVKPLYHKNESQFYFYVEEIFPNLNPLSPFTNIAYKSFLDYFKTRYNSEITNLSQLLLDVDYTSARLNLLTPRYVNRKGITLPMSTIKTKIEVRNNLERKQILIPELCILHPFPASFWKKAVCLPSILYRVNSLLIADELRRELAIAANIGKLNLDENERWPSLDFGWTLAQVLEKNNCNNASIKNLEKNELDICKNKLDNLKISSDTKKTNFEKNVKENFIDEDFETTDANDFVIDVFDPSKLFINDKNLDYDSDEFEKDFSRLSLKAYDNPKNEFFINDSYSVNDNIIFDQNQFNWMNNSDFVNCGIEGLTSISGLDNLNIESLSYDLAKINKEKSVDLIDNYESEDENWNGKDNLEEEEDAEFDPTYKKKNFFTKPTVVQEEILFDIQTNGLLVDNKVSEAQSSELTKICNSLNEEEVKNNISPVEIDKNYFNIEDFEDSVSLHNNNSLIELNKLTENLKNAIGIENFNNNSKNLKTKLPSKNSKKTCISKDQNDFQPGFGELLPIIKTQEKNLEKTEKLLSNPKDKNLNLKFDPFKQDHSNYLGPDPVIILQALTMSNASDGINLERLETVGDSFLKYSVTAYLYCTEEKIHEGKLSHLRSQQISNFNLFKLGKNRSLGEMMVATKFEPNDNWLPPGFVIPRGLEKALVDLSSQNQANVYDLNALKHLSFDNLSENDLKQEIEKRITKCIKSSAIKDAGSDEEGADRNYENALASLTKKNKTRITDVCSLKNATHIPYNLLTQHSMPDKSIADCVESLIGAYLISCGTKSALLFMKWLGLRIMSDNIDLLNQDSSDPRWYWLPKNESPSVLCVNEENFSTKTEEEKKEYIAKKKKRIETLYWGSNLDSFEKNILQYEFRDKSYLIQAFTHNSFYDNEITDCYQRLEFLGDAVLDFLITRYLFEDPAKHSPGVLTDLRSALVNNTFFASLAVKYDFQKYIKILSVDLIRVITNFVNKVNKDESLINNPSLCLCIEEGESDSLEDVQVPKALGDVFESVAGAIYLDSNFSLDAVWKVYFRMMQPEIEYFSENVPKSPIRELLEMKPQNVKFSKPEIIKGRKVSVTVEVFSEGTFVGVGRNKRSAKCTAAKKALEALKKKAKLEKN